MKRGDIYMVDLEPTKGREQQGKRPVVIVSPTKFNTVTKLPIIAPITTGGGFATRNNFAVDITGINITGRVICNQPSTLDITARNGIHVDTLPSNTLNEVLAKLRTLFE